MKKDKYQNIWIAFVHIKARKGYRFNDLIDAEGQSTTEEFLGAWANILVKAESIKDVVEVIPSGLAELNFEVAFIDKVEHLSSLIDTNELSKDVLKDAHWLIKSKYIFKISGAIFPYSEI